MLRTYEQCMLAILATPEDDQLRYELAAIVRASDPLWSEFIEVQLAISNHERVHRFGNRESREYKPLNHNTGRWATELGFFLGETEAHRRVKFVHGLPWGCTMNAYMFLEEGEYIMSRIAPLRSIEFYPDPDGDPFPALRLAQSPLLARLDEIRFAEGTLAKGDLEIIVSSPHLVRARSWCFIGNPVGEAVWHILR